MKDMLKELRQKNGFNEGRTDAGPGGARLSSGDMLNRSRTGLIADPGPRRQSSALIPHLSPMLAGSRGTGCQCGGECGPCKKSADVRQQRAGGPRTTLEPPMTVRSVAGSYEKSALRDSRTSLNSPELYAPSPSRASLHAVSRIAPSLGPSRIPDARQVPTSFTAPGAEECIDYRADCISISRLWSNYLSYIWEWSNRIRRQATRQYECDSGFPINSCEGLYLVQRGIRDECDVLADIYGHNPTRENGEASTMCEQRFTSASNDHINCIRYLVDHGLLAGDMRVRECATPFRRNVPSEDSDAFDRELDVNFSTFAFGLRLALERLRTGHLSTRCGPCRISYEDSLERAAARVP